MSLLVWLPLNGDLKNQGLSPAKFTLVNPSGALSVASTGGKISQKCYQRTTRETADYITSDINFLLDGDVSMCCWCKVTNYGTTNSANGIITQHGHNTGGLGITMRYVSASDYRMSINTGVRGDSEGSSDRSYMTYYSTTNIYNKWHHLCVTFNKAQKKIQMYIDGKLETIVGYGTSLNLDNDAATARPFQLFSWSTDHCASASYRPPCQLNDVRLYDHCLSPKEVAEIAKGLVAHYTLSNKINSNFTDSSGYGYNLSTTGTLSLTADSPRYSKSVAIPNGKSYYPYCNSAFFPYEHVTMNCWFKGTNGTAGYSNYHIPFASVSGHYEISLEGSTGKLRSGLYINGARYCITTNSKTICDGAWHMLTMTYDGATIRRYVDGAEVSGSSTSIAGTLSGGNKLLTIGHYGTDTTYGNQSSWMSDVRLYATALSATDIANLYKVSTSVNSDQTVCTYELNDTTTEKHTKITKAGLLDFSNIGTGPALYEMKTKVLSDGSYWARIFWHDVTSSKTWFASNEESTECLNASNRYSRMNKASEFISKKLLITNKLPETSAANFSAGSDSSAHAKYGNTSLLITGTTASEVTSPSRASFSLIPSHKYYARVEVYQETKNGSVDIYWPIAEPRMAYGTQGAAGSWHIISTINNRSSFTAGNYQLRLDYNCAGGSGKMWFDGAMLIDLTETFGAGNEPAASWCDANIPYFTGTQLVDCSTHSTGWYEFMLTYPRLSSTLYNRWKQTSSPEASAAVGYTPITTAWGDHAGGIRRTNGTSTYNCDNVGSSTWYAAIGQKSTWTETQYIPAANGSSQTETELWIRIDTAANSTKCSIYPNSIVAKDFYEI